MRIAVAMTDGQVAQHFGHCEKFALVDVDTAAQAVLSSEEVIPPPHEPGLLPAWLKQLNVEVVIAGGMGGRAIGLFQQAGIRVISGVAAGDSATLARQFLDGTLASGGNSCDHSTGGHRCSH